MSRCCRCVMDDSVDPIFFDAEGVCNYCHEYDTMDEENPNDTSGKKILSELINKMKQKRSRDGYDCLIGFSGGCDSSILLHNLVMMGVKPLVWHLDNGWDTEIAKDNMRNIIEKLNLDFLVINSNNKTYDDICKSFLNSGVPEIDAPADIALASLQHQICNRYNIRYTISGHSFRTEGWTPINWFYFDGKYIESICRRYGTGDLDGYSNLMIRQWVYWLLFHKLIRLRPLVYMDYVKKDAMAFLEKNYGWRWYGGHHLENKYTAFCNNYYLPTRYKIDFRIVEFSALIRSGQMTRDDALKELKFPPSFDMNIIDEIKYRLNIDDDEFDRVMNQPPRSHKDHETYKATFHRYRYFFKLMCKLNRIPYTFYLKYCR